jgi:sugar O-acyltransferase (sialic acid O-acetyltransferase NeuD family)
MSVLIIGAGGHAKVVADCLNQQGVSVMGFVDDNPALKGQALLGLPVLGTITQWEDFQPNGVIIAIGNNALRRKLASQLTSATDRWVQAIHPKSVLSPTVRLGAGSLVVAGAVINVDTVIGQHTIINTGATVDHDCVIGDFVHIAPGVNIAGGVYVEDGAFLGIGARVIPGCRIGAGAVIGAGATVIQDIPPHVIAKGIPARWD